AEMGDVLSLIEARAAEDPGRPLYSFLDSRGAEIEHLDRAQLLNRLRSIASHLQHIEKLHQGDRVLLAYPPGLEMISAFFACVWAGIVPVPVAAPTRPSAEAAVGRMRLIAAD